MSDSWHSYPKVYNMGHPNIADLFADEVIAQEKVDGSQFSFGKFGGELRTKSKGKEQPIDAPDKMFELACATVRELSDNLQDGWTYRAEYLQKPKHNVLAYDRAPEKHLILFDINTGPESYLPPTRVREEAEALGLECVPTFFAGEIDTPDRFLELLEHTSVLGGQKIEGVVIKNYARFARDGKCLMGKHVSERFREIHKRDWKERNPGQKDIISMIVGSLRTEARWDKAVIHLREAGGITDTPADIGKLIKEVHKDLADECGEEIKAMLYKWAIGDVRRGVTRGLPEYYKNALVKRQFDAS